MVKAALTLQRLSKDMAPVSVCSTSSVQDMEQKPRDQMSLQNLLSYTNFRQLTNAVKPVICSSSGRPKLISQLHVAQL